MSDLIELHNLKFSSGLAGFVENELLPGLDISPDDFWSSLSKIFYEFKDENKNFLKIREELQTKIDDWIHNAERLREVMPEEYYRNYQRNKKLIDLAEIPEEVQTSIITTFNGQKPAMRMKVLNYLIKKRCNNLIEVVEEFYNG